jgi:hypothetical protein
MMQQPPALQGLLSVCSFTIYIAECYLPIPLAAAVGHPSLIVPQVTCSTAQGRVVDMHDEIDYPPNCNHQQALLVNKQGGTSRWGLVHTTKNIINNH